MQVWELNERWWAGVGKGSEGRTAINDVLTNICLTLTVEEKVEVVYARSLSIPTTINISCHSLSLLVSLLYNLVSSEIIFSHENSTVTHPNRKVLRARF